jgi:hypothetical protein
MSDHKALTLADVAKRAAAGHSAFSPSGSKMWLTCAGSLIPNILSDDQASEAAAEGTVAHSVAEVWLSSGKRPKHLLGKVRSVDGWDIEITAEMMADVGDYVAWCQEIEDEAVEFLVETRVDLSDLMPIPDQGGTSDCIAIVRIAKNKYRLIVRDLKFGKGVRVFAKDNTQGLLYGYGAYKIYRDKYNIVEIELGICHPRLDDGTTTWTITPDQLLEFAELVKERAKLAWRFDAERTPSDAGCQWCKIKGTCPAAYQYLSEVTSGVFDDDEDDDPSYSGEEQRRVNEELEDEMGPHPFKPANPAKLSTISLAKILRYRKLMEQFFNAVEAELLDRAISREEELPGWKIVEGRANRKWPENEAPVYLRLKRLGLKDGAIYTESMISPAEAEKKLHAKAGLSREQAAKVVNALAIKPPGGKSLVRTSDNRKALPSDGHVFDDDEDE